MKPKIIKIETCFIFEKILFLLSFSFQVTGIFRALPHRVNPKMRNTRSVYKTIIDVLHFAPAPSKGFQSTKRDEEEEEEEEEEEGNGVEEDGIGGRNNNSHSFTLKRQEEDAQGQGGFSTPIFSDDEVNLFSTLAERDDVYDLLTASLAPSIFQMIDVKKGLLCQLFGGVATYKEDLERRQKKKMVEEEEEEGGITSDNTSRTKESVVRRGDINILLCGDPGTSKSQLLSYIHKLSPRGIYTSGKGSSSVGLTASVVKDTETGDIVLESGALVLSDKGIIFLNV